MSQTYKTIKYSFFNNHSDTQIVVFPQAMQTVEQSHLLISMLNKFGNILFIESGYFGVTKLTGLSNAQLYNSQFFRKNMQDLLKYYKFNKLYFIAGSVGAIHALSLFEVLSDLVTQVILVGPAFYRNRGFFNFIIKSYLIISIYTVPHTILTLSVRLFKSHSKMPWIKSIYKSVVTSIGALSYLLCLKEIVEFTVGNEGKIRSLLSQKVHTILGKNDNVFKFLCDERLCYASSTITYINSDHHSVLYAARKEIVRIINN